MAKSRLFSDDPDPLIANSNRPDPILWVRRILVVESLSAEARVIRSIEFRRGLNIINTGIHPGDDTATVGHSVGKTLLLRFIRYSLGESTFGSPGVRQAVAERFRTGYVLAEIVVDGESWVTARPIGFDSPSRSSFAQRHTTIEAFLAGSLPRERLSLLTAELNLPLAIRTASVKLPHANRPIEWLDLLGWLSRDQACRHRSHTEWRPQGTESHGLRTEDSHFLIRAVMDLLSPEDAGMISSHKLLVRKRSQVSRNIEGERSLLTRRQSELMESLSLKDDGSEYEMFADAAETAARNQKESLQRLLDDEIANSPLPVVQAEYATALKEIGAFDQSLASLKDDEQATLNEIRQLETNADADILQLLADQAEWCHLFPTKTEAISKGCPGNGERESGLRDPNREKRLLEKRTHLVSIQAEIKHTSELRATKTVESEQLQERVRQELARVENVRKPIRQRIERFGLFEEAAQGHRKHSEELRIMIEKRDQLTDQVKDSLNERKTADRRFQSHLAIITNCFRQVLSELLGHPTEATIELNSQGIYPRPANSEGIRGEAIGTSTTVLGFDLACLAASICGLGHHPRFLIHDSPREADMEEPMFHRLFWFVRQLENLTPNLEPSFQYIITTTTPPPKDLAGPNDPYVRLTLDARDDAKRLLGVRF